VQPPSMYLESRSHEIPSKISHLERNIAEVNNGIEATPKDGGALTHLPCPFASAICHELQLFDSVPFQGLFSHARDYEKRAIS